MTHNIAGSLKTSSKNWQHEFRISLFMQRYFAPAHQTGPFPSQTKIKAPTVGIPARSMDGSGTGSGQEEKRGCGLYHLLLADATAEPSSSSGRGRGRSHRHPTAHTNVYVKIP